ncbi:MAG: hypothetical protein RMY35_032075 [Nostoc sp. DedSLP01]
MAKPMSYVKQQYQQGSLPVQEPFKAGEQGDKVRNFPLCTLYRCFFHWE